MNTWRRYVKILDRKYAKQELADFLSMLPEEKALRYALAFSVAKWHPLRRKKRGSGPCGLCELFTELCNGCPAIINQQWCGDEGHPYQKWFNLSPIPENKAEMDGHADELYWHLMKQYRKEYSRND